MGRKTSKPAAGAAEVPGCFNGMWNAAAEVDESPVLARKSLSERKFSEGFEAPRNSLDISSAVFENARCQASAPSDEIPFGYEFALRKSSSDVRAPPRVSVSNSAAASMERCRSPSVIARLMGLDTLPPPEDEKKASVKHVQQQTSATELQAWRLLSERRDFLTSRSSREHKEEQGKCLTRQLSSSRVKDCSDEFLLFDVLPFRDHPQEKQLEKLKHDFQAQRQVQVQKNNVAKMTSTSSNVTGGDKRKAPESKEMLEAIQFLQSNKEFLVKFLQEPNSVFSKHIYDLQALAAKEGAGGQARGLPVSKTGRVEIVPQQNNIGFSRKLLESRKDQKLTRSSGNVNVTPRKEDVVQKHQRKESFGTSEKSHEKVILLKSNSLKKQSTLSETEDGLRRCRSFREVDTSVDPKELARQIAREVRENVMNNSTEMVAGGGEGSEPSSRRYSKEFRVTSSSQPNSPRAKSNVSSKEGRKHLMEKLKMTQGNQSDDESSKASSRELFIQIELTKQKEEQKKKGGKLLKLFSREPSSPVQKPSSDHSPRLLVRSKSVPSFVEEKKPEAPEALDRTHSCKQSTSRSTSPSENNKSKFSSLKSSLLGKKKSHSRTYSKSRNECGDVEHSVSVASGYEDHYTRTFRETEAQLATSYNSESNKFTFDSQSPRFLSVNINDGLDTSSDIHTEKSEQPSPVSVLERGFIEESPSPVSFEDVSSDLQELQMRLERLKLDESGRTYNEDILSEVETSPSPSTSPDDIYVSKLIHSSGFSNSITSLFNWHSPSCPIDPYLFAKLEADYSTSGPEVGVSATRHGSRAHHRKIKIGRSFNQVERRPETLHRQMLFDVVNEVLSKKFQHLWNDQPWHEIGKQGVKAVPCGRHLVHEVEREMGQYRHGYDRGEYPLENLVERDVNRGSQQWMETRDELRKITSQVEMDIFNGLIEELACSLVM